MPDTLVVYYSLGGTTRTVARDLAGALEADLDEIEDVRPRGLFGTLRGALESLARGLPAIRHGRDPAGYDLVVLATPVWGMSMSSPMRSYLHANAGKLHRAACVCTWGGVGGHEAALAEMRALAGDPRAPTLSLHAHRVLRDRYQAQLRRFADEVRAEAQAAERQLEVARA